MILLRMLFARNFIRYKVYPLYYKFGSSNCLYFLPLLLEPPSPSIHLIIRNLVNLLVLFHNQMFYYYSGASINPVKDLKSYNHHNAILRVLPMIIYRCHHFLVLSVDSFESHVQHCCKLLMILIP